MEDSNFPLISTFVGRRLELEELHRTFQDVVDCKQTKWAFIQGDTGLGKTALVNHFLGQVELSQRDPLVLIASARCTTTHQDNAYFPFIQLFNSLGKEGRKNQSINQFVTTMIIEVAPMCADLLLSYLSILPFISPVAKFFQEVWKARRGNSVPKTENLFGQFTEVFNRLAERQPIVAFIDDLQWADASSLELLCHLNQVLRNRSLLFICAYRPFEAGRSACAEILDRTQADQATFLELNRGIDLREYIGRRYPVNDFPADFIAEIQQHTGGHPLHIAELFRFWDANEIIVAARDAKGQEKWRLAENSQRAYPVIPTLDRVLRGRLRQMSDELREILNVASVQGDDFTAQVVARISNLGITRIYNSLQTIEKHYYLIREKGLPEKTGGALLDFYQFAHRFYRDYVYGELTYGQKRALHRQVGECLEALCSSHRDEVADQLALHFEKAGELEKSGYYALRAARFQLEFRYGWSECDRWCNFGLGVIAKLDHNRETLELKCKLLEQRGSGHNFGGKYVEAHADYQSALVVASQNGLASERIASLCERLASVCESENQIEEAMAFIHQGIQALTQSGVPYGEIHFRLDSLEALMTSRLGDNKTSVEAIRKALVDSEKLPRTNQLQRARAQAYNWLAIALSFSSEYSDALAAHQKAIEIAREVGDKTMEITNLVNLADGLIDLSRLDEAEVTIRAALTIIREVVDLDNEAFALATLARSLLARNDPRKAQAELTRAIVLSEEIGALWNVSAMRADLALSYLATHELNVASSLAARSVAEAKEAKNEFDKGYAYDALAQTQAACQSWDEAVANFKEAIAKYAQVGERLFESRAKRRLAEALLQTGDRDHAVELLKEAFAAFQDLDMPREAAEAQSLLDRARISET